MEGDDQDYQGTNRDGLTRDIDGLSSPFIHLYTGINCTKPSPGHSEFSPSMLLQTRSSVYHKPPAAAASSDSLELISHSLHQPINLRINMPGSSSISLWHRPLNTANSANPSNVDDVVRSGHVDMTYYIKQGGSLL
jgi:hypothetical protein